MGNYFPAEDMEKAKALAGLYTDAPRLSENPGEALGQLEAVSQGAAEILGAPFVPRLAVETIKGNDFTVWEFGEIS